MASEFIRFGLGQGLVNQSQQALNQAAQQRQAAQGLQALLGIDQQKAQALGGLPPQYLQKVLPMMVQQQNQQQYSPEYYEKWGVDPNAPPEIQKAQLSEFAQRRKDLQKKILTEQTRPSTWGEIFGFGKQPVTENPEVQRIAKELNLDIGNLEAQLAQPQGMQQEQQPQAMQPMQQSPAEESFGLLKSLSRLPGLLASGAAQTLGTAGGLFPLGNIIRENLPGTMGPEAMSELTQAIQERREPDWNKIKSVHEKELAEKREPYYLPEARDVKKFLKENVGFSAEPQNALERIFEAGGEMLPILGLSALRGAKYLKDAGLTGYIGRAFGPKAAGELTKKVTGSDAAGDSVSAIGYLLSGMEPDALKNYASQGFDKLNTAVESTKNLAAPYAPIEKTIEKISDLMSRGLKTPEKELLGRATNVIKDAGVGKSGYRNIKDIYETYRDLGSNMPKLEKAKLGVPAQELRSALKESIMGWARKNAPNTVKPFEDANELWKKLKQADLLRDNIASGSQKIGATTLSVWRPAYNILAKPWIDSGVENTSRGLKQLGIVLSTPAARKPFIQALVQAGKGNPERTALLLTKAFKAGEKAIKPQK